MKVDEIWWGGKYQEPHVETQSLFCAAAMIAIKE